MLQKWLRKCLVLMVKVSLLPPPPQSETGFQSFLLAMSVKDDPRLRHSLDPDQDTLREFVECNPCKNTQKFALDYNRLFAAIEKDKKSEQAGHLGSLYS